MSSPHVLVLPIPSQGHINALMNFAQKLVRNGFKISFMNTEFNHKRIMRSLAEPDNPTGSAINFVSIPDGLGPEDDRNDVGKLCLEISNTVPAMFEKLIDDITSQGKERISCIVTELNMGWALEIGRKMGIRGAIFYPTAAALFALQFQIPRLIDEGIIGTDGLPKETKTFQLSPNMALMDKADIFWCNLGDPESGKHLFNSIIRFIHASNLTEWWFCNTTYELEPVALSLIPKLLPIGPLLDNNQNDKRSMGQFWKEDITCLNWLDQHPTCSVIYVAFGSVAILDQCQLKELALGLKLTNKPFLWVIRSDDDDKTTGDVNLVQLIGNQGKIIRWAPQQKVLSHPSIACFISHCGWNSVMEGLSNGVPFLCWPYFCDQFFCKKHLCDELMVGLGFDSDETGMVSRHEIKKKVERLLTDENIKIRSLKLKETIMNNIAEDGRSSRNFNMFMEWLKE